MAQLKQENKVLQQQLEQKSYNSTNQCHNQHLNLTHLNNKEKNPNLLDKIEKMKRVKTLIGIDQKLRDDQQTVIKMIREN